MVRMRSMRIRGGCPSAASTREVVDRMPHGDSRPPRAVATMRSEPVDGPGSRRTASHLRDEPHAQRVLDALVRLVAHARRPGSLDEREGQPLADDRQVAHLEQQGRRLLHARHVRGDQVGVVARAAAQRAGDEDLERARGQRFGPWSERSAAIAFADAPTDRALPLRRRRAGHRIHHRRLHPHGDRDHRDPPLARQAVRHGDSRSRRASSRSSPRSTPSCSPPSCW